ncbi:MAG: HD domain-containing protein [bacterium]|nr:HD domain-containing protein [bacterium]
MEIKTFKGSPKEIGQQKGKIYKKNGLTLDWSGIKKEARKFFINSRGSHNWDHTLRVYNLCIKIGSLENVDTEVLGMAAILHDIGREEEYKSNGKVCHAKKGAILAKELLEKHNIDQEKIEKIISCIKTHRFRSNNFPQSREAQILFDADKLDAIGACGIGRAFLFSGEIGARLHNKDIDLEKTKPYTKEDTAYREFSVKLCKIKDRMLTEEGKKMAIDRHKFMADFFKRLDKEIDGYF